MGAEWVDFVRLLVLGQGFFLIGFSAAVMIEANKFRMPPPHVWAIAISYVLLIAGYMLEIGARWGDSLQWRTWVAVASFSFGIYSMWLMWRAYLLATRLRRHERKTVEAGNRIMRETFRGGHKDEHGD